MTENIEKQRLTIIIPAYNEESRITETLESIKEYKNKQDYSITVLIIDDGSKDNTLEMCKSFAKENHWVHILGYHQNRGKGYAVRKGVLHSVSEYVLLYDADMATPIDELNGFWEYIVSDTDIVIASRPLPESSLVQRQPFYREFGGRLLNRYIQFFAVPGIRDTQCGFKLFKEEPAKKIFNNCRIDGFSFDIEVLHIAKKMKYKIKEAPIRWFHKSGSKVKLLQDGFRILYDTLKIRHMHRGVRR